MAKPLFVKIKIAWWFRYYLIGLVFLCRFMGAEPDEKRIEYWLRKAITITTTGDKANA